MDQRCFSVSDSYFVLKIRAAKHWRLLRIQFSSFSFLLILENLRAYPMDKFSMHRDGHMEN